MWMIPAPRILMMVMLGVLAATAAGAQDAPVVQPDAPIALFLDCPVETCNRDYFRTEIAFVNHVVDRADADVHLLITTQSTTAGTEYTLGFIGLKRFAGQNQTLRFFAPLALTEDEIRAGLVRIVKLGLARYAAETRVSNGLNVTYVPTPALAAGLVVAGDPWNLWIFNSNLSTTFTSERSNEFLFVFGTLSANRTTNNYKIDIDARGTHTETRFRLNDDSTFTNVKREYGASGLVVKSVGPHAGVALQASTSSSTFLNEKLVRRVAPGVEFNVFPYTESTRRLLTLQYTVGVNGVSYLSETIFGKTHEALYDQTLLISLDTKQPWGSMGGSVEASQFLPHVGRNHVVLFGHTEVRLFKGFSLLLTGSGSRVRDQIFLARDEATTEEILVRQRQLATSHRYSFTAGISYTFGSSFANVVNSRFAGAPGGFLIF